MPCAVTDAFGRVMDAFGRVMDAFGYVMDAFGHVMDACGGHRCGRYGCHQRFCCQGIGLEPLLQQLCCRVT